MTVISQKHVAKFLTNLITDYRVFMGLKVKLYIALRVHCTHLRVFRATRRHLLPATRHKWTHPAYPQPERLVLD